MQELQIIQDDRAALCLMKPPRSEIVRQLREPGTAAGVARELGLSRQQVAYHVRALEAEGLLDHLCDRRSGNCVERVLQASAQRYVLAPPGLADLRPDPEVFADRFSSAFLIANASQIAEQVATLREQAEGAGKKLATLSLDTQLSFGSPAEQHRFAEELLELVGELAARYQSDQPEARRFTLSTMAFPCPPDPETESSS